jgi:ADP-L-glycero-D-manno-heptose 6-epimerase
MKIIVTGACGFIGSNMVRFLNEKGFEDLILVDNQIRYLKGLKYNSIIGITQLNSFNAPIFFEKADFIIHLGALTDTFEKNYRPFEYYNEKYSRVMWEYAVKYQIPIIYASSAATYGNGDKGFSDSLSPKNLEPLNPYAISKNEFDKFSIKQSKIIDPYCQIHTPPFWAGLKFFNVYGINEYHKNKMASVVYRSYLSLKDIGKLNLFKYGDQKRDFVYVEDVCEVIYWLLQNKPKSNNKLLNGDIYNLGTGIAREFKDLANAVLNTMNFPLDRINWINMPDAIKDSYQSFTEADITKLRSVGYDKEFFTLENGVSDYLKKLINGEKSKRGGISLHTSRT